MSRSPGALLAILVAAASPLGAQAPARTFLLLAGKDTIAVEQLRRAPGRLDGALVVRGANQRWTYRLSLDADERVTLVENEFRLATEGPAAAAKQTARLTFRDDSVFVTFSAPTPPPQRLGTRPGAMPYLNPSFAMLEQVLRRARVLGRGDRTVPLFAISGGQTFSAEVRWLGADSAECVIGNVPARLRVAPDGSVLGGTVPSQGLTLMVVDGAPAGAMEVVRPDYSAPAGAAYTAEEVRIPTPAGHTLAGTLTRPRNAAGRVPAVVMISGSGPQDRDETISLVKGYRPFREIAEALAGAGIAVLRVDDRGTGESGGNAATATSADFADDVRASLALLRSRPDIDGSRLALVGHSEGGLIAPMVAERDSLLRAIVLMAGPAYTGRRIIEFQNRYGIEHAPGVPASARDSLLGIAMRSLDSAAVLQPWLRYFLTYDPLATARRVRTPVLILQGATDQQVTADQAPLLQAAFREGGNRDVTERVFPATNHLFVADPSGNPAGYPSLATVTIRPEVLRTLVEWLSRRLGP